MDREELLNEFNGHLDEYAKHKSYMDKAREQAAKFSSDVIEKVIADHQIKASMVGDEIAPLVPRVQAELTEVDSAIRLAEQSKGDLGDRLQELELRRLIGELSDEDFEAQSSEGRETVEGADGAISSLSEERSVIQGALERWSELSGETPAPPDVASVVVEEVDGADEEDEVEEADVDVHFDEPAEDEESDDPDEDDIEEEAAEEEEEASEDEDVDVDENVLLDPEESVEIEADSVGFDMEEDAGDVNVAEADDAEAVEVQIDDDSEAHAEAVAVELSGERSSEDLNAEVSPDDPRRALLLYQEGTPEEQIYPFTGDVFTIGRGRDNDLQIKNDSKVSRFHCKLFRRGTNFYVEDNKSSNGTMINGELVSERRLFGGEEIIIGETFFRFRIM